MNIIPISDMERMAQAVSKSGLFGIKQPEQALALMLIAQAEGMHPAVAARDYHIVQGRPALKADSMLARFQAAGGKVTWVIYADDEVKATFSHPSGGSVTLAWTIDQAKQAGLTNKDVWRQYPRAMLRARVISEGIRTVYPGVAVGVYTPEEIADFDQKPSTKDVSSDVVSPVVSPAPVVTPAQAVDSVSPTPAKLETPKDQGGQDMRASYLARIKASGWSRSNLAEYALHAWGVKDSSKLTMPQLAQLASIVESADFATAMNEVDGVEDDVSL